LIRYFSWTWVGVLVSDNESGLIMSQMLQKEFALNGICFAFLEFIPYHDGLDYTKKLQIARCLSHSAANVIISYGDRDHMLTLHLILYEFPISEKVWIISFQWDVASGFDYYFLRYDPFNGSLAFSLHASSIPGFEDFLLALTPDDFPNDIFIYYAWWEMYSCVWKTNKTFIKCNGTEKMQKEYENVYKDLSFYSYSIYNAVNTLVYTLHYLQLQKRKEAHDIEAWEMHKYIKKITITDGDGNEVHFDENGDMPSDFDILNWIVYPNQTLDGIRVGTYVQRSSFPELRINESLIRWSPTFNGTPHSTCSETCHIGYKKKPKVGFVACCYDCVSCPEGEISNQTGRTNKIIIWISFLCNLMFIGHPLQVTCILRQTVFGVTFSIVISSVLAKTVTVVIAFNATRPRSKLRNYVGTRVSNSIVIFCSLMQMIICTS
ncbi:hypothetical protein XELAEV_18001095mg, partial [Xenopus laevis]